MNIQEEITQIFGNKLRVRVSGLCIHDNNILLIKHQSLGPKGILWAPPGGGISFGESAEESLKREFLEETGLTIEITRFLFVHEFLAPPLHAIELFFEVKVMDGNIIRGTDPEMAHDKQIIREVKFYPLQAIKEHDPDTFHHIFAIASDANKLLQMTGYYKT